MKRQQGWIFWLVTVLLLVVAVVGSYFTDMMGFKRFVERKLDWNSAQTVPAPKPAAVSPPAQKPAAAPPTSALPQGTNLASAAPVEKPRAEPPKDAAKEKSFSAKTAKAKPADAKAKAEKPKPVRKPAAKAARGVPTATSASQGGEWRNWGAAPYANSFAEACRKKSQAIDGFDWPAAVKERFKQRLGSDCSGGKEVWLTPRQLLKEMWSGPDGRHASDYLMKNKEVAELPVPKSPEGRAYRKGSVAETAKALEWTEEYEGVTYHLVLPYVCFNWGWWSSTAPPKPIAKKPEECAYVVHFTRETEVVLRQGILGPTPVQDLCLAILRAGSSQWQSWWRDECTDTWCDFSEAVRVAGQPLQLVNSYVPKPGMHIIRVPKWMVAKDSLHRVVLCTERAGRVSSDTRDVRWEHYRMRSLAFLSGQQQQEAMIAWVFYDPSEHRPGERALWWTFGYYAQQNPEWKAGADQRARDKLKQLEQQR